MGSKDISCEKSFVGMVRAWVAPQPEDSGLTEAEAKRRVARAGAELMDAGEHFDDQTLARMTGVPHYCVSRMVPEFEYEIDSTIRLASGRLYLWDADEADSGAP